jgi:hypothetical protein
MPNPQSFLRALISIENRTQGKGKMKYSIRTSLSGGQNGYQNSNNWRDFRVTKKTRLSKF